MPNAPEIPSDEFARSRAQVCIQWRFFVGIDCESTLAANCTRLARWFAQIACCGASLSALGAGSPQSSRGGENRFVGLLQNSPFGAVAVSPAESPVEFRGYVCEEGSMIFSLAYPEATGSIRNAWVELDEHYADYVVRSFDRDSDTVQVEQRGQTLTLKLKLNRLLLLQAPEPAVAGVDPATAAEEKTRLETITAEIGRRRALRQANAVNPDSDQP